MTLLKAILMGLIQGIAEFLPISSSGHLALCKQILNINTDTGILFDIMLHFGTLIAIFIVFFKDIKELIIGGFSIIGRFIYNIYILIKRFTNKNAEFTKVIKTAYDKFVMLIIVSTIPTGILGVLLKDIVTKAGESLLIVGICLIITAILLYVADHCKTGDIEADTATYKKASILGVAQGIATLPGISRSGTTITVCLLCGFKKEFAIKYSFIMSIPAVLGAVVLDIPDLFDSGIDKTLLFNYSIGTLVSFVVGYFSIVYMMKLLKTKNFSFFTIYCSIVGLIAIIANFLV